MSDFPFMPLFAGDYLADTRHLRATEHGAYLLLLMVAWRMPSCKLPDDDKKLSSWAAVDLRTWRRIKPSVMGFWALKDGEWKQKRLAHERVKASKRARVAKANGKHGGRPKTLKTHTQNIPAGLQPPTQIKASTATTTETKEGSKRGAKRASPMPEDFQLTEKRATEARTAGIASDQIPRVFQAFVNYHTAKGSLFKDWDAAWRTWCGNEIKFSHNRVPLRNGYHGGQHERPTVARAIDNLVAGTQDEPELTWPSSGPSRGEGRG